MGHGKVISSNSCCCSCFQHGRINHGRVLCLQCYWKNNNIQKKRRLWSGDEIYVIHRQLGFLSMHSNGYPEVDKVVKTESSDHGNEDEQTRGIELLCEPGLPEGWEQCLDLETGECFYIDKSCGKRTKRDPRPILVEANKNIRALIPNWCSYSTLDHDRGTTSNCFHQDSTSDSTSVSSTGMECSQSTEHDGKIPILKACSKCLLYFLIPTEVKECPLCKTDILWSVTNSRIGTKKF